MEGLGVIGREAGHMTVANVTDAASRLWLELCTVLRQFNEILVWVADIDGRDRAKSASSPNRTVFYGDTTDVQVLDDFVDGCRHDEAQIRSARLRAFGVRFYRVARLVQVDLRLAKLEGLSAPYRM